MIQDYERSSSPGPQEKKKRVRVFEEFQPELCLELHLTSNGHIVPAHSLTRQCIFFLLFLLNKILLLEKWTDGALKLTNNVWNIHTLFLGLVFYYF